MKLASVTICNNFENVDGLWRYLDSVNLMDEERLRPGWDTYFMVRRFFGFDFRLWWGNAGSLSYPLELLLPSDGRMASCLVLMECCLTSGLRLESSTTWGIPWSTVP